MMKFWLAAAFLVALVVVNGVAAQSQQQENICWLEYSIVDANPLAADLTKDLIELRDSQLIRDSRITTWVYVDGSPNAGTAIEGLLNPDGSPAPAEDEGVRYLKWDHAKEAYVVMATLGEKNSDDPTQLREYLAMALPDCIASGSTQFMMVMSAHGSGFGFGGDNTQRHSKHNRYERSRRSLVQSNQNVAGAIQSSLDTIEGAPDRLDLLGFDACLQASVESLKDFQNITKYYLASEATEPGHGWWYEGLTAQANTLEIAKQNVDLFADTTQSGVSWSFLDWHQTPKTLAVFDLDMIDPFYEAYEDLFDEMTNILIPKTTSRDTKFYSTLSRSRLNSASFLGIFDDPAGGAVDVFTTMDVGDFFRVFSNDCNPAEDTPLATKLALVQEAQQNMTVYFRVGEDTNPAATGLSVTWPSRREYVQYSNFYDSSIFDPETEYDHREVPKFNNFLKQYVSYAETGAGSVAEEEESVCTCPKIFATTLGEILFNRTVQESSDGTQLEIDATLADTVDSVLIEYGVNVTHIVLADGFDGSYTGPAGYNPNARRRRRRTTQNSKEQEEEDPFLRSLQERIQSFHPTRDHIIPSHRRKLLPSSPNDAALDSNKEQRNRQPERRQRKRRRHLQESIEELDTEEDYFIVFGGWIDPHFTCDGVTAAWGKQFYGLANHSTGVTLDFVYVYHEAANTNSIPVFYFPASTPDATKTELLNKLDSSEFLTIEEIEADYGGLWGYLQFSSEAFKAASEGKESLGFDSLSLYALSSTTEGQGEAAPAEIQRSQGGFILPILYVESVVDGFLLDYLVGGFSGLHIDWKQEADIDLIAGTAKRTANYLEAKQSVIDISAYDYKSGDVEPDEQFTYFVITYGDDGEIEKIEEASGAVTSIRSLGGFVLVSGLASILGSWISLF